MARKTLDYAALGRKGGKARLRTMTRARRREIARKGAQARARKITKTRRREIARRAVMARWARAKAMRKRRRGIELKDEGRQK